MRIGQFETCLFQLFPREDAEPWDHVGLVVGDPSAEIAGIACALEPRVDTVLAAAEASCNVLLCHHPVCLQMPSCITPEPAQSSGAGAAMFAAVQKNVSLISLHTNLDKSSEALAYFAELLGYSMVGRMQEPDGYGAVLDVGSINVGALASRCSTAFGSTPILWGSEDTPANKTVFLSGSLSGLMTEVINCEPSTVIAGECSYHVARELYDRGLNVILIGHDASERPYAHLLKNVAQSIVPGVQSVVLPDDLPWHIPDVSTRS